MSTWYRFYLLKSGHIAAIQECECTQDADALLVADEFLKGSVYPVVEVWDGPRRVGILSKPIAAP